MYTGMPSSAAETMADYDCRARVMVAQPATPKLIGAYRKTLYAVGDVRVRVGQRCPELSPILDSMGATQGVFITAWNPLSRRMPPGWNARMQQRLDQASSGYPRIPARGSLHSWQEDHLFVAAPLAPMRRLARRFRQRALLVVGGSRPARLVFLAWKSHNTNGR
jgi:hypothetical protein